MRDLLFAVFWMMSGETAVATGPDEVRCGGALSQGGLIVCTGPAGATIAYDGRLAGVSPGHPTLFGVRRNAALEATLLVTQPGQLSSYDLTLTLAERYDDYRVLEGMDCDRVDARSQEQKDHAGESWVKKQAAFASFDPQSARLSEGFIIPSDGPPSSPFGPTRKYIGVSAVTGEPCERESVHRGYDIATPIGTPINAPASGVVTLADLDLYYEGGTVFLDHGSGLNSVFMHMSAINVEAGDVVSQGDLLGKTGNTGRTTGPHLHWAVKWRDVNSDDRGEDFYIDPALLLNADLLPD